MNLKRFRVLSVFLSIFVVVVLFSGTVMATAGTASDKIVRIAFTDPAKLTIGDMEIYHHSYAAMLAFKGSFEKTTGGEYTVELYPNGVLGDAGSTLEQLIAGNLEGSTPADGALAPFYANIQVFSIPYLFDNPTIAYDVLDGEFGKKLFDDMASKSGLRVVSSYDNGGYRNFSNSKREIRSAEDMKGMNIRVMESPVYLNLVKSLGASATPVAFLELYSALQTGVVDGQENSALTTLGASLDEVQPYYTLDGHLLGLAFLTVSEEWYQGLDEDIQRKVDLAGREASIAARGTCRYAEALAIEGLIAKGVQVYSPTAEELSTFKVAQEPVMEYLRNEIDPQLVDDIFVAIQNVEEGKETSSENQAEAPAAPAAPVAPVAPVESTTPTTGESSNNMMFIIIGLIAAVIVIIFAVTRKKKN